MTVVGSAHRLRSLTTAVYDIDLSLVCTLMGRS